MADPFSELCLAFVGIDAALDNTSWEPLTPWIPTGPALLGYLNKNSKIMPPGYNPVFLAPLKANAQRLADNIYGLYESRLNLGWPEKFAFSRTVMHSDGLLGAASAWSDPPRLAAVQRFQAVVSDIFESFITKTSSPVFERLNMSGKLPPLVMFGSEPELGPCTIKVDDIQALCLPPGSLPSLLLDLSLVTQPAKYASWPLLWGVIGHEAGGHAVTHAVRGPAGCGPKLADELKALLAGLPGISGQGIQFWGEWADEAAADVYGLLNIGPSFALSLGAWLTMSHKEKKIGNTATIVSGIVLDLHPAELLRMYVVKGAFRELSNLRNQVTWLTTIQQAIDVAADGIDHIAIDFGDRLNPEFWPLAKAISDAELVGRTIVTKKMDALDGYSIQDIETWNDTDEAVATKVRDEALLGHRLTGLGADPAQLIAGATMALSTDHRWFDTLNTRLSEALDECYRTDKVFNGWPSPVV
jgi:hypothetical protein